MISYEQIEKANATLTTINLKGKDYAMVPQRVKAFRMLFPDGFIVTRILNHENGVVLMQAEAGYYQDGERVILGTGMAQEVQGKGLVNGTSYIENCETSAVGRALGMMGLGIDAGGICSAEELANAIVAQGQMGNNAAKPQQRAQEVPFTPPVPANKTAVTTESKVPQTASEQPKELNQVGQYINKQIKELTSKIKGFDFASARKTLIADGKIKDIKSKDMTMEDAEQLFKALWENFGGAA